MVKKKEILLIALVLVNSASVLSYIDPGTGGMIAGSIWPFIVGILAAIGAFFSRRLFNPIKNIIFRNKDK